MLAIPSGRLLLSSPDRRFRRRLQPVLPLDFVRPDPATVDPRLSTRESVSHPPGEATIRSHRDDSDRFKSKRRASDVAPTRPSASSPLRRFDVGPAPALPLPLPSVVRPRRPRTQHTGRAPRAPGPSVPHPPSLGRGLPLPDEPRNRPHRARRSRGRSCRRWLPDRGVLGLRRLTGTARLDRQAKGVGRAEAA